MVQNKLLGRIQLVKVIYQNDLGRKFSFHPKVPFVIKPAKYRSTCTTYLGLIPPYLFIGHGRSST